MINQRLISKMWLGYVRTDTFSDNCTLDKQIENLIDCGVPSCNISVDIEFEGIDHTPLLGEMFSKLGPCDHLVVQHLGILGSTSRAIATNVLAAANLGLDIQTIYPIPDPSSAELARECPSSTSRVNQAAMQVMKQLFLLTNLSVFEVSDLMKIPSKLLRPIELVLRNPECSETPEKSEVQARDRSAREIRESRESRITYAASVK